MRDFLRENRPAADGEEEEEEFSGEERESGIDEHEMEEVAEMETESSKEYLQPIRKKSSIVMYQNLETSHDPKRKRLNLTLSIFC